MTTYIFMDVDGVLVKGYHHNPRYRRMWDEHIERDLGITPGDMKKHFFDLHASDLNTGKRDLAEALADSLPHLKFEGTVQEIINYWFKADSVLDTELLALLAVVKAKSGAQLYLATNQEKMRADYLWKDLKLSELFTDIAYSGKIGYAKPQPEFFAAVNKMLDLAPEKQEILFFDDNPANVAAAKQAGWLGFLYETSRTFLVMPYPALAQRYRAGMSASPPKLIRRAIVIGALGYFIDMLDIQIFSVLRVPSLTEMGVAKDQMAPIAGNILSVQMAGMILGGFLWGWIGDRFGRLKALYGSILIYSIGTLLCSTVHNPISYGAYRFISGFGLAGETGAAVTLIAELMPAKSRGWSITIISGFGFLGPATAVCLSWWLSWRIVYILAGIIGLVLLLVCKTLSEPNMFKAVLDQAVDRGSLRLLANRKSLLCLLACVILGLPSVYGWNVLNFFSAEFSHLALAEGQVFNQKVALLVFFLGTAAGDVVGGALTQYWQSRRKALVFSLQKLNTFLDINTAGAVIITTIVPIALFAVWRLKETHGIDLNYHEPI